MCHKEGEGQQLRVPKILLNHHRNVSLIDQNKDSGALFFLAVTNRGRSGVCCTRPAGPVISGSEEALSERTWARERNGEQAKFLSRSQFINVMVAAYIALE